jgi:hypothetical protein
VYRRVAPEVEVESEIVGGAVCAPPAGVIVGVATVPTLIE